MDGSASWWIQGLGHGDTSLTLAAAYTAGRFVDVALTGALLSGLKGTQLIRVFHSDDGGIGVEVAAKTVLRAARIHYGWSVSDDLGITGLNGAYHGDTIRAMDCAEQNAFN